MRASVFAWFAILTWASMLAGCSTFRPFSRFTAPREQAAKRSIDGLLTLARLAENRGESFEAERLYRALLERAPENPLIYHRLAVLQAQKGRFDRADGYFEQALNGNPDDPKLLSDAAYNQYLQHRLDQAESLLQRALEIDPQHQAAKNNLALVRAEQGDMGGALALFRQTGPEARAYANLGFVYARSGEVEQAKAAYSRALSIEPQMRVAAEALIQLARFENHTPARVAQNQPAEAASIRLTDR